MIHQTIMPQPPVSAGDETSPFVVEFYMVRGTDFVCMAYYDKDGKWRNAFSHHELRRVVSVLE